MPWDAEMNGLFGMHRRVWRACLPTATRLQTCQRKICSPVPHLGDAGVNNVAHIPPHQAIQVYVQSMLAIIPTLGMQERTMWRTRFLYALL